MSIAKVHVATEWFIGQKVDVMTVTESSIAGRCAFVRNHSVKIWSDEGGDAYGSMSEMLFVRLHSVSRKFHVMEHAFELLGELIPAFHLELG